ncbi:gamma-glutamyltransferase family protein, partial [Erysipelatoclostridium ramosum]
LFHHQFEAMKMAFADGLHHITDAKHMKAEVQSLLHTAYGRERSQEIAYFAKQPAVHMPPKSGTVYLCTADREGNMVSFIQSN